MADEYGELNNMDKKTTAELIACLENIAVGLDTDAILEDGIAAMLSKKHGAQIREAKDRLAELEALEKPEWFFRWASRAMASGDFKGAVETIFYHPGNPYQKNNPWAKQALQPKEAK